MATSVTARAPAWIDGVSVPGAEMRAAITGGVWSNEGFVRGLRVVQIPTAAMKIRVPAGLCVVGDGQAGYYPLELAAQTDLDIGASSPTLPRIDSVIAEIVDNGGSSIYRFRVVAGTANASPVQPPLPYADQLTAKTLRIANVAVAANALTIVQANISTQAVTALDTSYGRLLNVSSDGGRPSLPYLSEGIFRTDKNCIERSTSLGWLEGYLSDGGPAFKTYTPAWTSSGTNPGLGNGTAFGRYQRMGRQVLFLAEVTLGSTSTNGSGSYRISLPIAPKTGPTSVAFVRVTDPVFAESYQGQALLNSSTPTLTIQGAADLDTVSPTVPATPVTGTIYRLFGSYETAS